jgi:hypothetical protein
MALFYFSAMVKVVARITLTAGVDDDDLRVGP